MQPEPPGGEAFTNTSSVLQSDIAIIDDLVSRLSWQDADHPPSVMDPRKARSSNSQSENSSHLDPFSDTAIRGTFGPAIEYICAKR